MRAFLSKIISIPKTTIPAGAINVADTELIVVGKHIQKKIGKLFSGSLAIREVDAGSDNACENELTALSSSYYDISRFGINFVASPRHADMLMVTGPVSRNSASALKAAYDATPTPRLVVAVGDDAIDGGIFQGSYAISGGVSDVVPVDFAIPGDPPSPLQILRALLKILEELETKQNAKETKK